MELFMRGISMFATKSQVTKEIADVLHGPDYTSHSSLPLNFHVHLFVDRRRSGGHKGQGALTLPTYDLGVQFLQDYGEPMGRKRLSVDGRAIKFTKSRKDPRPAIVEDILRLPYQDPRAVEEREKRTRQLQGESIPLKKVQFGWECRDQVFSSELEYRFTGDVPVFGSQALRPQDRFLTCRLSFDDERREIRIDLGYTESESLIIAIRFSQILWCSANISSGSQPSIFFSLATPPAYETQAIAPNTKRQRLVALDSSHALVAPYTSLAIRLVCEDLNGPEKFRRLSRIAQLHNISDIDYPVEYRKLFSVAVLDVLENWLRELDWLVAFQVQALVRSLVVDPTEMLGLRSHLTHIVDTKGSQYASSLLRQFATRAKALYLDQNESRQGLESIEECFIASEQEYSTQAISRSSASQSVDGVFDCHHVLITPTTMHLDGPFPERSNRVIRSYPNHHDCFLRVSFVDEDHLQYRFDRDVDGSDFIRKRVGHILLKGLTVAGIFFKFLAYSQSALKEHAVWFVSEFFDSREGRLIDAAKIIASLGSFDNLDFDPDLIYCPARYGARVSQAFTATDESISVEAEESFTINDISNDKWCFTDGVGTMSLELAKDIWQKLQARRRRPKPTKTFPRAFQIRFMGSKGMLSVDYLAKGRAICLRHSMIKFAAPKSRSIEIAQAFDRPRKYYLNRPLIMILEHIGKSLHACSPI
jgi:RNA-dependent RNA polymerase